MRPRARAGAGRAGAKAVAKAAKRWLILGHRWLGIATGLFFALWIGSGLVMLCVPFPALTEAERLARLAPVAWDDVAVAPDAALAAAGLRPPRAAAIGAFDLEMRGDEPVYRFAPPEGRITVSARTAMRLGPIGPDAAVRLAGGEPGRDGVEAVERDQWTVTARYDPLRPFHKVLLADAAGTALYVSRATGEIALDTTRFERGWNWAGAVVHWIYPTVLRARPALWHIVVVWLSGIAMLGAASGLALGILRLRPRRRYPGGRATPYRGVARWHHLFGLAGGVGLTTFIVSGWLSMNPNEWFSSPVPPPALLAAYAGEGGPVGLAAAALPRFADPGTKALRFARLGGRWLVVALGPDGPRATGADGAPGPDEAAIATAAATAVASAIPGARPRSIERLTEYDAYWYPRGDAPPLPVLRLRFDDGAATWLHVDPRDGRVLSRLDRSGRANRWLFDALHRLDLPVLTLHRPAREAAQWVLNLLAGVVALTGIVVGWRRLRRRTGRRVA